MSSLPRTGRHQPLKMLVEHNVVILIEIACSRDPTPVKHFPRGLGSGKEKADLCTRDTVAESNLALNADRRGLWLLCQSQQRVDVCSNLISTCFLPIGQLFAQQFLFLQSDSGIFLMYIVSYTWNSHSFSFYLFFPLLGSWLLGARGNTNGPGHHPRKAEQLGILGCREFCGRCSTCVCEQR